MRLLWLADHLQYAPFLFPSIGGEENELILHFNSDGITASFGDPKQTASDGGPDSSQSGGVGLVRAPLVKILPSI